MTLDDIKERLASLGYIVADTDNWLIGFCIDKVKNHIKNNCNTTEIPEGLQSIAVDMVCGEFLFGKKQSGQSLGFDFEVTIKSIVEGDTTVTFDNADSAEMKYDALINYLRHSEVDFGTYRRIKW